MPRSRPLCLLTIGLAAALSPLLAAPPPTYTPKPGERPNPYVAPAIPAVNAQGQPMPWGGALVERFTDPAWQAPQPLLADWELKGTHSVDRGVLRLGDPKHNRENCCVMSKKPYINFVLEADCRLVSDPQNWGGLGLWFRAAEPRGLYRNDDLAYGGTSGYAFDYTPGRKAFTLVRRPHTLNLAAPVPMVPDRNWHRFRVEAVGNQFTCTMDGKTIFRASDPSPKGPFWWGYAGIGVASRGAIELRSLSITPR